MPAPHASHKLTVESYTNRIDNALTTMPDQAPLLPLLHAYRSVDDFTRVLEAARPWAGNGLWIRRFGYLCDDKLDALRQEWSRA